MNTQRMWSFAVASVLTLSSAAVAQQQVEKITFQQAIEIALRQNVDVLVAENNVENARLAVQQQGSTIWPTFAISAGGSNSMGRAFDTQTGTLTTKQTQSANSGVSSNVVIYDPNRGLDVASARSSFAASEATFYRGKQTAVFNVAQQFVTYLGALSALEVQKENLASAELLQSQIQRFADAGARPISELYNARSQVASAQLAVVNAERNIENAKFALMRTLQLDAAKDYDFVRPDLPTTSAVVNYSLDSLTKLAYTQRRDVAAAQKQLEAAQLDIKSASRGRINAISVNAQYGSSGRFGQDMTFTDQFDQNRSGNIGLGVGFNIFDRGTTRINRTRASINAENAQIRLGATRQAVALDVRTAWFNIRSAQQQLVAAQAGLVAATQALEATQQRYNVGATTLLEVTQLRAARVNAQTNLSDAQYNLLLNQAAMAYYTGELNPSAMTIGR